LVRPAPLGGSDDVVHRAGRRLKGKGGGTTQSKCRRTRREEKRNLSQSRGVQRVRSKVERERKNVLKKTTKAVENSICFSFESAGGVSLGICARGGRKLRRTSRCVVEEGEGSKRKLLAV